MPDELPTVGVILAGGTGTRVGLHIPKQLVKVAGKPILEHTLALFDEAPEIDELIVLMPPDHIESAREIVARAGLHKVTQILAGGATRNATTRIALDAIPYDDCKVLFHDAVRPLLEPGIITGCVAALDTHDAVDVAIPSADTIIAVDENDVITGIPPRDRLRRGQTPQGFRIATIRRAYQLAAQDPAFEATDDCGVVLRYLPEVPIVVVPGSEQNLKVTHPIDLFIADKLFQLATKEVPPPQDPAGYAELLQGRTLVVLGGSSGIGADVATLARGAGADVHVYSRSLTGTHVENPDHLEKALRETFEMSGRIDYVVLTAGVLHRGPLADTAEAAIEETVAVNYLAALHTARAALPYLRQTGGQLLLYTSSSYTRGRAGYSVYSSTKAALVNLTQALADEWAPLGVRVNCINPERTATPMRVRAFGEEPSESLLTSESVALTSLDVLLSEVTGHVVDVRRIDPGGGSLSRPAHDAERIAAALAEAEARAGLQGDQDQA
jgi:2-C-methyl-D-erythritol 4-phosphate cytidylyltransferase